MGIGKWNLSNEVPTMESIPLPWVERATDIGDWSKSSFPSGIGAIFLPMTPIFSDLHNQNSIPLYSSENDSFIRLCL